jgi:phosphoserine aminotransferase
MSQPYHRVFNFSAGPCTLPVSVLEEARDDLMNYKGKGMSVMEMSHRSKAFEDILKQTEADFRTLAGIPEGYHVLFLQGGASFQFSMVPISFMQGRRADYIVTGTWGEKGYQAAQIEGDANLLWSDKANGYRDVPDWYALDFSPNAEYICFTSNETIQGVQFKLDPTANVPLVCDMSSDILARPCAFGNYDLVYAGAQKNMGPAGATLVIIKDEMLAKLPPKMHPPLDYRAHSKEPSLYNTPPCWSIYMCGLVYKWMLANGGLEAMKACNEKKAAVLYAAIDGSGGYYKGHAAVRARSTMNVTFTLPSEELTEKFVNEAAAEGLDGLKGHRSLGGIRASIYNAFPIEGCEALASLMSDFARKHG